MRTRRICASMSSARATQLLAACAAMAIPCLASAAITYSQSSSSVTLTHDANTSSGGADKTVNLAPPSSSSMTSFQINNTISGSTNSVGKGSIGSVTNPTTATFTLAAGTGVTQVDPTHVWGPSSVKFNLNGVWNTGTTAFGPTATGYFSMGYAGSVGGAGSMAQVKINLTFKDDLGNTLRSAISFIDTITASGSFAKTYTSSVPMTGGTVAANRQIRVNGTVEFLADNGGGPVDLAPVNFDCGGAPPTATWVSGNGDFNNAANWNGVGTNFIVEPGSTLPTVPNQPGDRARFVNLSLTPSGTRNITVSSAVTLGTLDVDDDDAVAFLQVGGGALNFATMSGDAVIHTGNSQGSSVTNLSTPISLGAPLKISVDSASDLAARSSGRTPGAQNTNNGVLNMGSMISGPQSITTIGDGTVALLGGSVPNTFTGGLHSRAGFVDAGKMGALGTGTSTVQDSRLNYQVSGAANPNTVTGVTALGQVTYSPKNTAPGDRFSIGDLAAIDAGANSLSQFVTNGAIGSVNLTLAPGAMIAHQTFDPGQAGNPLGIDPNAPLYIFGVSQFFGNSAINVGLDSNSPWRGFGGPRGNFSFGDGGQGQLGIAGHAELVSLRGTMLIASQLVAVGPTVPSITVRGGGHVVIDSPPVPFPGTVTVESGTLAITSGWTPQSIMVLPGGAMGGPGSNAPLTIQSGGHIAPGDDGGFQSIGTFQALQSLSLANGTLWDFDLDTPGVVGGPNDLLVVNGPVVLDGILNVNGLENFGPGIYTIALLNGPITDNTVDLGSVPPNYDYQLLLSANFAGNSSSLLLIVSDVPEPASIGFLAAAGLTLGRRTRRKIA
ncbi:hypothetical protein BH09PLA1_BH09PLA1_27620 [soil metagenome]